MFDGCSGTWLTLFHVARSMVFMRLAVIFTMDLRAPAWTVVLENSRIPRVIAIGP